jgi:hypothetical protein
MSSDDSGLANFTSGLTSELTAWGRIFQSVAQIALGLVDTTARTMGVVASLWSDGKNTGKMLVKL